MLCQKALQRNTGKYLHTTRLETRSVAPHGKGSIYRINWAAEQTRPCGRCGPVLGAQSNAGGRKGRLSPSVLTLQAAGRAAPRTLAVQRDTVWGWGRGGVEGGLLRADLPLEKVGKPQARKEGVSFLKLTCLLICLAICTRKCHTYLVIPKERGQPVVWGQCGLKTVLLRKGFRAEAKEHRWTL